MSGTSQAENLRRERISMRRKVPLTERQIASIRSDRKDGIAVTVLATRFRVCADRIREIVQGAP